MLISLPLYLGLDSFSAPVFKIVFGGLSLAFALPVLVFSASDYWKSAWLSLRQRVLTLDVPIALGLAERLRNYFRSWRRLPRFVVRDCILPAVRSRVSTKDARTPRV
jgi:hypothetical protein